MGKSYIFVCGCPRSGTTALTHVFNWHPDVVVGIERYVALFGRRPADFGPDIFTMPRFWNVEPEDCGYSSIEEFAEYRAHYGNKLTPDRVRDAKYIGDKITQLYTNFGALRTSKWHGADIVVVQIIRNFFDVANSYERRKADANDQWSNGRDEAAKEWARAMERGAQMATNNNRGGMKYVVVSYEGLFEGGEEAFFTGCLRIMAESGLSTDAVSRSGIMKVYENGLARASKRKSEIEVSDAIFPSVSSMAAYELLKAIAIV